MPDDLRDLIRRLEAIASDGRLLANLSDVERERLLRAVAEIYSPDRVERRRLSKKTDRRRKAARVKQDQSVLAGTGIRARRKHPIHTPNYFLPENTTVNEDDARDDAAAHAIASEAMERQHCYVGNEKYTRIHHFYDGGLSSSSPRASRAILPGATRARRAFPSGCIDCGFTASTCAIRRASRRSAVICSPHGHAWTS